MSRRVLIVESTATSRSALKAILSGARYDTAAVSTGREALDAIREQLPDAILLDAGVPDMDCVKFCARVAAQLGEAMPPIVVMLESGAIRARTEAIRGGAAAILSRPVERSWLLTNLRALLRSHETRSELRRRNVTAANLGFSDAGTGFGKPARLALVSTDQDHAARLAASIKQRSLHRIDILNPEEAIAASDDPERAPEIFLLCHDPDPDEMLTLMAELRARPNTRRRAAILVEYDPGNRPIGARALDQGASDLVRTDASVEEIALRIDRQLRLKRQDDMLRASLDASLMMAVHDSLTELFNRRYAMRYLEDLFSQIEDTERNYGMLLMDIDHFKSVNDTYGHPAGDAVLKQVARRLRNNLREGDLLARIGGEEFLVALPECLDDEAFIAADRLRQSIAADPFILPDGTELHVTLSIGAICGSAEPEALLARADEALYAAKEAGRNRVERARPLLREKPSDTPAELSAADNPTVPSRNARYMN
ncbi:diguanylate cyclase [Palleronia sp. LCG004]|uniref:diguanylate cyclase n=1 Tax=Palleronia sp. LCG004 TaxID=3079304 RepID=UPI002942FC85|nr:diguanylate cyclase [Palleronia sp. LCG004]WOI55052.1 diguanylate cyclase [Palleronia sp. LCG004]